MPEAKTALRAFEPDVINVKRVIGAVLMVIATVLVCGGGAALAWRIFAHAFNARPPSPHAIRPPPVAGPALQTTPSLSVAALDAENRLKLHRYRWVDRSRGIVQIPIEQAMLAVVERDARKVDPQ